MIYLKKKLHTYYHGFHILFIGKGDKASLLRRQKGQNLSEFLSQRRRCKSRVRIAFSIIFRKDIRIKPAVVFLQFPDTGFLKQSLGHIKILLYEQFYLLCRFYKIIPEGLLRKLLLPNLGNPFPAQEKSFRKNLFLQAFFLCFHADIFLFTHNPYTPAYKIKPTPAIASTFNRIPK